MNKMILIVSGVILIFGGTFFLVNTQNKMIYVTPLPSTGIMNGTSVSFVNLQATGLVNFNNITSPTFVNYILSKVSEMGGLTASDVWNYTTRTLTNLDNIRANRIDYLDATISSRLASSNYVTERGTDNAALAQYYTQARATKLDILTDWLNDGRLDLLLDAIKAKTDTIVVSTPYKMQTWSWGMSAAPGFSYYLICGESIGTIPFGNEFSSTIQVTPPSTLISYWVSPCSMTLTNVGFSLDYAIGGVKTFTYTVRLNGVDTAATIIMNSVTVKGSYSGSISISAGDRITIKMTPSAGGGSSYCGVVTLYYTVP